MKKVIIILLGLLYSFLVSAQINTDRVTLIGRNALYYEDYILSIQYFNQVIKAKPYLPEPYYYRAIAKYYLDDTKGAEDDCTLAIERNPFMVKAYQLRGDARRIQNNYDEALEDFQTALDVYPNDKFILINIGIANIQKKNFDDSETILDDLVKKHPNYTEAYLVRGNMYQEKGDTIKAFENYGKAIEMDKYMGQAYSMRGILRYQTKEYEEALADFNEAIRLEPSQVGNYINRGLVRYSQDDLRGAMSDYDVVIDRDKYNVIARFNRGLLRGQVGDNNRAIEDFDVVLSQEPANYMAYVNRGVIKSSIGDYRGAIKDMDVVLEKYPDFSQGFFMRSEAKRKLNDLKGAERDFNIGRAEEKKQTGDSKEDTRTREQSDSDLGKFNLLVVADKQDEEKSKYSSKYRGRVQNKQVSIDLMPRFVASYYERDDEVTQNVHFSQAVDQMNKKHILPRQLRLTNSVVALNTLQIQEHFNSIDELSKQISDAPSNAGLYYARAIEYMLIQDFSSSIEDFNKAIEANPRFALAYFSLGIVYTKKLELKENENSEISNALVGETDLFVEKQKQLSGKSPAPVMVDVGVASDYEQIVKNYNRVIELDPEFIYTYYNRAEIRYTRNDYRSAILDYNEALRLNPNFAEAYYNRGLCRFYINDKDRALEDMRKAGELGIIEAYSIIKRMTE